MNYKLIHPNAKCPTKGREGDAAYDLYTPVDFDLYPGEVRLVDTGFQCELPLDTFAKIFGRSKLAAQGIVILGGVVDNNYRGSWGIALYNAGEYTISFKIGDRIAQFVLLPMIETTFVPIINLSETARGEEGIFSKIDK